MTRAGPVRLVRRLLRPLVPRGLVPHLFRGWVWLVTVYERLFIRDRDPYLPPPRLRFKVAGSPDRGDYLSNGRQLMRDIETALNRLGHNIRDFKDILDFGCGCGRTLRWLADRPSGCNLYGSDVDGEAIGWCRQHLDFASFSRNPPLPPTDYKPGSFDLIYLISVFTHLNEEYQLRWLEELERLTRPGGVVLISVHGPYVAGMKLSEEQLDRVRGKGIFFLSDAFWKLYFPNFYQTCFHTPEYIRQTWSKFFDVADYIERGVGNWHDLVVLRKRKTKGERERMKDEG